MASKNKQRRSATAKTIKVGDRVILWTGVRKVKAEVIEDRGFIGVGGRQLVRIQPLNGHGELDPPYEVPAEELQLAK